MQSRVAPRARWLGAFGLCGVLAYDQSGWYNNSVAPDKGFVEERNNNLHGNGARRQYWVRTLASDDDAAKVIQTADEMFNSHLSSSRT